MGLGAVLLGAAEADVGAHDDQRRSLALARRGVEGGVDRGEVVAVLDAQRSPAVGREAGGDVLAEGERGRAVDRDAVVVVEELELAQAEMTGERGGLRSDALHQVAVRGEHPDAVAEHRKAVAVEARGEVPARRSPCRPRSRSPGRAGRWWFRLPACAPARGVPASASRADGSAAARRAAGRSRRGGAGRRAARRRGRRRGRSGRDRARPGRPGRSAGGGSRASRRAAPGRAGRRGGPTWPPRPCRRRGSAGSGSRRGRSRGSSAWSSRARRERRGFAPRASEDSAALGGRAALTRARPGP